MKVVIVGASRIGIATARKLISKGEEVIIVDHSREALETLSDKLDCGMLAGDGTDPDTLRDAFGDRADVLLSLTPEDQDNILACLLAKSLGFDQVVPRIGNPQLFALCDELGLQQRIAPEEEVSQRIVERLFDTRDQAAHELPWPAHIYTIAIRADLEVAKVGDLTLPGNARPVCIYREEQLLMANDGQAIQSGDQVVIVTDGDGIERLCDLYGVQSDD